jgi:hydroxymethylbilane synthase
VEEGSGAEPLLTLTGMVGTPDGRTLLKEQETGKDPEALGLLVADKLIARGADRILAAVRE